MPLSFSLHIAWSRTGGADPIGHGVGRYATSGMVKAKEHICADLFCTVFISCHQHPSYLVVQGILAVIRIRLRGASVDPLNHHFADRRLVTQPNGAGKD